MSWLMCSGEKFCETQLTIVIPVIYVNHQYLPILFLQVKWCLYRDHFVYVPSQWEMTLYCKVVSHWLGTYIKWSLLLAPRSIFYLLKNNSLDIIYIHIYYYRTNIKCTIFYDTQNTIIFIHIHSLSCCFHVLFIPNYPPPPPPPPPITAAVE